MSRRRSPVPAVKPTWPWWNQLCRAGRWSVWETTLRGWSSTAKVRGRRLTLLLHMQSSKSELAYLTRLSLQVNWEPSTQRMVSSVWLQVLPTRPTPMPWPPLPETLCSPMLARPVMEACGGRVLTPLQLVSHSQTGTAKPGSKVTVWAVQTLKYTNLKCLDGLERQMICVDLKVTN